MRTKRRAATAAEASVLAGVEALGQYSTPVNLYGWLQEQGSEVHISTVYRILSRLSTFTKGAWIESKVKKTATEISYYYVLRQDGRDALRRHREAIV